MPTALITGVAGQDGAYLAQRLLSDGFRVVGLRLPGTIDADLVPYLAAPVELVEGDVTDRPFMAGLLTELAPNHLYNLAGISSVARSWEDPTSTTRVNALAVVQLLELLRDLPALGRATRFLQASSAEIFGQPERSPQDERTAVSPTSPYGAAKALAHQSTQMFRTAYGLHASTVILYNHESPLRAPAFVTRKITRAAAAISLGLQDELVLGALDIRRDWGFAGDYVDAMARAVSHDVPGDYVVATGESHSLGDLIDLAFGRVGISDWAHLVRSDPAFVRPAEITSMVGDASHAREVLGWAPSTSFEQLVHSMVDADLEILARDGV